MIGCPHCNQALPIGQSMLTAGEKARLPLGNQHTKWNVIRWQAIKGAAEYHSVSDWSKKVDPELTYEENLKLMARQGTDVRNQSGPSVRELSATDSGVKR